MKLIDLFTSKLEIFRLEQRYTKRRSRRSTFVSDAVYVDGEYIHAASPPASPGSSYAQSSASAGGSPASTKSASSYFSPALSPVDDEFDDVEIASKSRPKALRRGSWRRSSRWGGSPSERRIESPGMIAEERWDDQIRRA